MTPYLILDCRPNLARTWSNDVDAILTRISASFGAVTRDVSQNGNWIRVMSVMESFERPHPKSVPSPALTLASVFK